MVERLIAELAEQPAEPKPGWYCPTCRKTVPGVEVTYHEYHEVCNTKLTAEQSAEPIPVVDGSKPYYVDMPDGVRRKYLPGAAEQPAEQGEPWAWSVYVAEAANGYVVDDINDPQLVDDATNHNATVTPLYPIPDPRIAALEGLLREALVDLVHISAHSPIDTYPLCKRIEAALGKEG